MEWTELAQECDKHGAVVNAINKFRKMCGISWLAADLAPSQ
jgi:hypothetical protein